MNIRKLYENDLKTEMEIKNKLQEIKKEYEKYKKIIEIYQWEKNTTCVNTCKRFKEKILIFEKWLEEF